MRFGGRTQLDIYELPDTGSIRLLATLPVPPSFVHDFAVTEDYLVFIIPPLRLRLIRQQLGFGRFCDNLDWRPAEGVEVLVVPIDDPMHPTRFRADPFFHFHLGNAYQEGARIALDVVRYPDFAGSNGWLAGLLEGDPSAEHAGRLCRAIIDLTKRSLKLEERSSLPCEFPQVSPRSLTRAHRYTYTAAHSSAPASRTGPFDKLAKIDMTNGNVILSPLGGASRYVSEPIFVPTVSGGAEDDGWLLALVHDGANNTAHLAVMDARAMEGGAVARAHFDGPLPPTFHGVWAPARQQELGQA
jgi:all-trans-8'-apo-beta-carotenal 15,15'-oxygenase